MLTIVGLGLLALAGWGAADVVGRVAYRLRLGRWPSKTWR